MTDGIQLPLPSTGAPTCGSALAPRPEAPAGASFRDALRDAARDVAGREAAIDRVLARRGAPLSPEQLLAVQATVHRYSQEVELAGKLVDKLTGAARQVLTSQQ